MRKQGYFYSLNLGLLGAISGTGFVINRLVNLATLVLLQSDVKEKNHFEVNALGDNTLYNENQAHLILTGVLK